ncbi:MAG: glycosyltransferase family 2 protein, partial [Roseovarius sp.]
DWLICSDCDEFLQIRVGDGTLDALFEATGEADAISFCWKLFGHGGRSRYTDTFVTEQFVWAAPEDYKGRVRARGLKTMFRPSRAIRKFGVHRPKYFEKPEGYIWKDAGGQLMPDLYYETGWAAYPGFTHDFARLNHYAVRTIDSFLVKKHRGRTNHIDSVQGADYFADMSLNMEKDSSMLPTVERTREEFDRLLQDAELKRLHKAACAWHRAKIAELKADPEWARLHDYLQTINPPGKEPTDAAAVRAELAAE